jgi:long-chain-fatty-acid--CoA ligase ACSBG
MLKSIIIAILILTILCIVIYRNIDNNNKNKQFNNLINYSDTKYKNYTILDFLKLTQKKYPKEPALKIKLQKSWNTFDYSTYLSNVTNFAQSINYWLGPKTNLAILGFNSPGWVYAHLGVMMNGGISIGLYSTFTPETCSFIMKTSNVEILVVENSVQLEKFINIDINQIKLIIYYAPIEKEIVDKFKVPVMSMGNFMTKKKKFNTMPKINNIATIIYPDDIDVVNPMGRVITHKNIIISTINMLNLVTEKSNQHKFVSYFPLNHIMFQISDIYLPIMLNGTVYFSDRDSIDTNFNLLKTMIDVKPTIFIGIPKIWERIYDKINNDMEKNGITASLIKNITPWKITEKYGLQNSKLNITTTSKISEKIINYMNNLNINLYNVYQLSEAVGIISYNNNKNISKIKSVGLPIMDIKVSNDGEILIKGSNLFKNYFGKNKKDMELYYTGDWFKTGDIGYIDSDQYLFITGKKGHTIQNEEIENQLKIYLDSYFEYIVVFYYDNSIYTALFVPKEKKNKFITLPEDINNIIKDAIDQINIDKNKDNKINLKKWLILKTKFVIGNELTPTFKFRRNYINNKYWSNVDLH